MTVWLPVVCPDCGSDNIIKHGKSPERKQRYRCRNSDCLRCTFVLDSQQAGRKRETKQKIVDMALNGSVGFRSIAQMVGELSDAICL